MTGRRWIILALVSLLMGSTIAVPVLAQDHHYGAIAMEGEDRIPPNLQILPEESLPERFNWGGYVTGVRHQGGCGSCWAFAAVGVLESRVMIDLGIPGWDNDLSEQYLVSACGGGATNGCGPDTLETSGNYLIQRGTVEDWCLDYHASANSSWCNELCPAWYGHLYKMDEFGLDLGSPDKKDLKNYIYQTGPIAVFMEVYKDFDDYGGGYVYRYTGDDPVGNPHRGGHFVILTGWDGRDGHNCFIGKNSWGKGWGDNGIFEIGFSEIDSVITLGKNGSSRF